MARSESRTITQYPPSLPGRLWEGVSGPQSGRAGLRKAVCNESAQETVGHSQEKSVGAHPYRAQRPSRHQGFSLLGDPALCIPDRNQAPSGDGCVCMHVSSLCMSK